MKMEERFKITQELHMKRKETMGDPQIALMDQRVMRKSSKQVLRGLCPPRVFVTVQYVNRLVGEFSLGYLPCFEILMLVVVECCCGYP
jgi:hypothetical protein